MKYKIQAMYQRQEAVKCYWLLILQHFKLLNLLRQKVNETILEQVKVAE